MNHKTKAGEDDDSCTDPFFLMAKPIGIHYTVNINEPFVHSKQFEYLVHALDNATEMDQFTLNLTTPGGAIQAVLPLLGAMDSTEAQVHVHACSDVASAGTLLLMKAHSVSMNDYVEIMFHQVRFGAFGEGWNVEKQVEHVLKSNKRLLRDSYRFFFTDSEIEKMLTGTPYYMDREEFIQRYTNRADLMESEIIAMIEAEEAEQEKPQRKPRAKKSLALSQQT